MRGCCSVLESGCRLWYALAVVMALASVPHAFRVGASKTPRHLDTPGSPSDLPIVGDLIWHPFADAHVGLLQGNTQSLNTLGVNNIVVTIVVVAIVVMMQMMVVVVVVVVVAVVIVCSVNNINNSSSSSSSSSSRSGSRSNATGVLVLV